MTTISDLFNEIKASEKQLFVALHNISNHSVLFQTFYNENEDKLNNDITLNIAFSIENQVNFNLLYDIFSDINKNNIIDIVKSLNYLDSDYLSEILTIMKYNYPLLNVPYDDLSYIYDQIIIKNDEIETYIINNCTNVIFNMHKDSFYEKRYEYFVISCKSNNLNLANFFVTLGVKISCDEDLLIDICRRGHINIVNYILTIDKDVGIEFPLMESCKCGHLEIVKLLLKNGADVESLDNAPLIIASKYGQFKIVKFLIENGADIHKQNDRSLVRACYGGHLNVVKFLITHGANINVDFCDPLNFAIQENHLVIVKCLVESGADLTDLDFDMLEERVEIKQFLIEHGVEF